MLVIFSAFDPALAGSGTDGKEIEVPIVERNC